MLLSVTYYFITKKPNTLRIGIVADSIGTNIQFNKPNEIRSKSLPSNKEKTLFQKRFGIAIRKINIKNLIRFSLTTSLFI